MTASPGQDQPPLPSSRAMPRPSAAKLAALSPRTSNRRHASISRAPMRACRAKLGENSTITPLLHRNRSAAV